MEQILNQYTTTEYKCPYCCPAYGQEVSYKNDMLPQTDDILQRAVNISIGVVDGALGAGFGININSTEEEIDKLALTIRKTMEKITK